MKGCWGCYYGNSNIYLLGCHMAVMRRVKWQLLHLDVRTASRHLLGQMEGQESSGSPNRWLDLSGSGRLARADKTPHTHTWIHRAGELEWGLLTVGLRVANAHLASKLQRCQRQHVKLTSFLLPRARKRGRPDTVSIPVLWLTVRVRAGFSFPFPTPPPLRSFLSLPDFGAGDHRDQCHPPSISSQREPHEPLIYIQRPPTDVPPADRDGMMKHDFFPALAHQELVTSAKKDVTN